MLNIWLWIARTIFGTKNTRVQLVTFGGGASIAILLYILTQYTDIATYISDISSIYPGVGGVVLLYTILALIEEGGKFLSGRGTYRRQHLVRSDLIIFGILSALGFACAENVIYLLSGAGGVTQGVSLAISRGFTGFLFHSIFTGVICLLTYTVSSGGIVHGALQIAKVSGAFLLGVGLHVLYNILLHYGIVGGFFLYTIAGYVMLTYVMYKSDRVYVGE